MKQYPDGWAWQPDKCPCDQEFIEWMEKYFGQVVFHMGTGLHHRVGAFVGRQNTVLGVTLAPSEIEAYIEIIKQFPSLGNSYQVFLCDLHTVDYNLFPTFDIATLFHLGEIVNPYGLSRSMESVVRRTVECLNLNGVILGYTHSVAAHIAIPLMDELLQFQAQYRSLRIYARR